MNIDSNPYITCIIKSINHTRTLEYQHHLHIHKYAYLKIDQQQFKRRNLKQIDYDQNYVSSTNCWLNLF